MTNAQIVFHGPAVHRLRVPCRFDGRICALLAALIWGATLSAASAAGPPSVTIVADLIDQFDEKLAKNGMAMGPRGKMLSGRSTHRALYEHPKNANDATITYSIRLPDPRGGAQIALVGWACVSDAVLKQDKDKRANGVRMIVRVDDKQVFSRVHTPGNWMPVFVPLDTYAGKTIALQLATNAIDGNTNYDWAYWGDPRVMRLPGGQTVGAEPVLGLAGLLTAPASTVGDKGLKLTLQPINATGAPAGQATDAYLEAAPGCPMSVAEFDLGKVLKPDATGVKITAAAGDLPSGLRLHRYGSATSIGEPYSGRAIFTDGEEVILCYALHNKGPAPWVPDGRKVWIRAQARGPEGSQFTWDESDDTYSIASFKIDRVIPAGEKVVFTHRFKAKSAGELMAEARSGPTFAKSMGAGRSFGVYRAAPILNERVSPKAAVTIGEDHAVIQNPACRVVFAKRTTGRRGLPAPWTANFQMPNGDKWRTVAVCPDVVDVCVGKVRREDQAKVHYGWRVNDLAVRQFAAPFRQARCSIARVKASPPDAEDRLELILDFEFKRHGEESVAPFRARLVYALHKSEPIVDVIGELVAEGQTHLRRFCPISLRVADGLPTKDRGQALFPGLEYLDDGEPSSSTRDAHPPINNRLMPDPLKVTVPMMMVSTQVGMVTLMWDPNQKWNGKDYGPCAAFGSPNLAHRQENHLMEVFVPTFPDSMNENERLAAESYEMKPGSSVSVSARIVLRPEGDAVAAMRDYFAMNPPPKPAPKQHDLQTLYAISRHGLTKTVWYEDKQKSSHCVGWSPTNAPQFGVLLWLDAILAADPAARKASLGRARLIWKNSIRDGGPAALASGACCHIMREEAPFYTGHVEAVIKQMTDSAAGQIRGRNADGVWGFQPPRDARHESLGPRGYASQGIVAQGASALLRKARVTGSAETLQAGLKALAYHDRFHVPHGAQGWECPIYEPDVLGAAYAVGAYVDAYEMTGERQYLDRAIYWAWTGMAFQYVWQAPDREQWMRYASIPVFGTTFFTHSWLGNPVQWCGLVYAYYLQKLAPHDTSFPWKQIAEGITVSGEWLQFGDEKPELKGSYPDGLYGRLTKRCPAMINPEDIILNRYAVEGHDPRVKTTYVRRAGEPTLHITSCAKLGKPALSDKTLTVPLTFYPDQYSGTLLANCSAPASVALGNQSLKSVQAIPENPEGWKYLPETKHLIVRARHADNGPVALTVRFK